MANARNGHKSKMRELRRKTTERILARQEKTNARIEKALQKLLNSKR